MPTATTGDIEVSQFSQFYHFDKFCQCIYHMKIGLQIKCLLGLVIQYYACQQVHCPRNHS